MKPFSRWCVLAGLTGMLVFFANFPAFAGTCHIADFSGAIKGGSANCKPPFDTIISQGGPVSGSFVYDDQLIPGPASGLVNVSFSSFPNIAKIRAATAFTINLGAAAVTFTLADAIQNSGAVQYLNDQFHGSFFDADFTFQDNPYRLDVQGGTWSIKLLDHLGGSPVPLTPAKVNGLLNFSLTNVRPFNPTAALPPTILLLEE